MGLDEIAGRDRLAIVGVAKNCGKTTTLNVLMRRRRELGLAPPALVSIGIDGEAKDVLLGTEKPPVVVAEGQWVATAEGAIGQSTARFEYIHATGFRTPLGEIMVGRAVDEGTILLAGLRHRAEVKAVVDLMAERGPGAVWIDGAYGRVAGAHPELTEAVVVSTGAVAGPDIGAVAERTADLVSRLTIPAVEDGDHRRALEHAVDEGCLYVVLCDGSVEPLGSESAVVALAGARSDWSDVEAVAVCGLVSDRVLEELLTIQPAGHLLVPDGTVIHAGAGLWRRFRRSWKIWALSTSAVVGLGFNPTCVTGRTVDADGLRAALEEGCPQIPVFNPLQ